MIGGAYGGCGAWSTADDYFALFINGVDYSDPTKNTAGASIAIDSLRIGTSLASNASASFTILDMTRGVTIQPWSDVVVWYAPSGVSTVDLLAFQADAFQADAFTADAPATIPDRILFSGLVVGETKEQVGLGRTLALRCIDYGILLDKTPSQTISIERISTPEDSILKVNLPAPITMSASSPRRSSLLGDSRVQTMTTTGGGEIRYFSDEWDDPLPETLSGSARSLLDSMASRMMMWDYPYTAIPFNVYVDPLRRLNAWNSAPEWAPLQLTDAAGGPAPENLSVESDYTGMESGVFITDTWAPFASGVYSGDLSQTNGRLLAPSSITRAVGGGWAPWIYGNMYLGALGVAQRGSFDIESTADWHVGQWVIITSAAHGLAAQTFLISSVDWSFMGTTANARIGITGTTGGAKTSPSQARMLGQRLPKVSTDPLPPAI
jgi:hypothetical protein